MSDDFDKLIQQGVPPDVAWTRVLQSASRLRHPGGLSASQVVRAPTSAAPPRVPSAKDLSTADLVMEMLARGFVVYKKTENEKDDN